MKLVDDWKEVWRWHSTHIVLLIAALPEIWDEMPPDIQAMLPPAIEPYLPWIMVVAFLVGRVRKQA